VGISLSEKIRYDNYKVFRIIPQNEEQRSFLLDLESNNPGVYIYSITFVPFCKEKIHLNET
jgi:hypothetical protein